MKNVLFEQREIKLQHFVDNKIRDYVAFLKNAVNSLVAYIYEFLRVFLHVQLSKPTNIFKRINGITTHKFLLFICSAGS